MNRPLKILASGTVATMTMGSAAFALTIDDFTVPQRVASIGASSSTAEGTMFGNFRYMEVSTNQGDSEGTVLSSEDGSVTFNNNAGTTGTGYLVYDGSADRPEAGAGVDDIGLGDDTVRVNTGGVGQNIVQGSVDLTFFDFDLSNFDPGLSTALFSAFAWDTGGNRAEFNEIVGGEDVSPRLFLNDFVGDSIDWTDVGALAFRVDSTVTEDYGTENFDAEVGSVSVSQVPLPASALLLLGGLGGFAGLSAVAGRRRKA